MRGLGRLRTIACHAVMKARRERWIGLITDTPVPEIGRVIHEIQSDRAFLDGLRRAYRQHTTYRPFPTDFMAEPTGGGSMFFHLVSLYVLVRIARPEVVVETGGTPGKSSAFILRAIERNSKGKLYTIDLPPASVRRAVRANESHEARPYGLEATNWCVPDALRKHQRLLIGPAQEILPALLSQLRGLDLFIHDSDHSYEHMTWELRTALPFVRPRGYLWADDILTNTAWHDFCDEHRLPHREFISQGVVRKPA